jgi:hypothetical protein
MEMTTIGTVKDDTDDIERKTMKIPNDEIENEGGGMTRRMKSEKRGEGGGARGMKGIVVIARGIDLESHTGPIRERGRRELVVDSKT